MGAFMPCYYKLPEYVESTPRSAASDKEAMNVNRAAYNMEKKKQKRKRLEQLEQGTPAAIALDSDYRAHPASRIAPEPMAP